MQSSPLARTLLAAYLLLVVYASLHPFTGWRDQGLPAFAYLDAAWPRYLTGFDIAANLIAYFPLGALGVLALHPRLRAGGAVLVATFAAACVSVLLEATQGFLPSRIPSNLDVLFNTIGAGLGALAAMRAAPWLLDGGPLRHARQALLAPGTLADAGLVLLGLWLFTQLDPTTPLFGTGDLRYLVASDAGRARLPGFFVTVEAVIATANIAATGLIAAAIIRERAVANLIVPALVLAALLVRTAAFAILMRAEDVFAWLTPGAAQGLLCGVVLALAGFALPRTAQLALAAILLMAATVLVNLAPPNPYTTATLKVWEQGHFLHFNGLMRLISSTWPFAAIAYAIALAARGGKPASG